MRISEINNYIVNYMDNDKRRKAIMLDGPWGSGKSYFLNNHLSHYLDLKNKHMLIISLYGESTIEDLNRALFMEIMFEKRVRENKLCKKGYVISKTVLKGVASFFGVSLTMSKKDLSKLYSTVDLTNKLIVFDDFERSNLDVISFFGYVNSLVERDGAKVMVVVNETEIYRKLSIVQPSVSESGDASSQGESFRYSDLKEKTIGDTLFFQNDETEAIMNIWNKYNMSLFDKGLLEESLDEIVNFLSKQAYNNLRTLESACQKTEDMFALLEKDSKDDLTNYKENSEWYLEFIKTIFFSNLYYFSNINNIMDKDWIDNPLILFLPESQTYPILKVCYDYNKYHIYNTKTLTDTLVAFDDAKLYVIPKNTNDKDVNTIFSYATETESEIKSAIKSIEKRLLYINDINFRSYGHLANHLIVISQYINIDISKCLELLVDNLAGRYEKIDEGYLFSYSIEISSDEKRLQFEKQKSLMISALHANKPKISSLTPSLEGFDVFCDFVRDNEYEVLNNRTFFSTLDCSELAKIISQCTAKQIENFRRLLSQFFTRGDVLMHFEGDKDKMIEFREELKVLDISHFDGIQNMQYIFLLSNLETYISVLTV